MTNADTWQEFFYRQLSKLHSGIYELAQQHPDKTFLIARQLDELQDEINRVVRPLVTPRFETASSLTRAEAEKTAVEAPPSAILNDEQLSDFFSSDMVQTVDGSDFLFSEAASASRIEELLGCSNDANAIANLSTNLCHDEIQQGELGVIVDNNNPYQTTIPPNLQTSTQYKDPTYSSSQVEIEDGNLCKEVSSLGHTLENSRIVQRPNGSRKRTANELIGTPTILASSNKQRSRSDRTKQPQNLSNKLSASSDKITRELNAFLDEHKVENPAYRSTLLKCVGCFADFSPIYHLNETLQTIRKETNQRLLPASTDIATTNQKLDQLDRLSSTCSVLRRVYLVRLLEHRDNLETQLKDEGSNPSLRKNKGCNKVASRVLERMLEDMYPTKNFGIFKEDSYSKDSHLRKKLQNNLTAARKWSFIHEKFSLGMLFLIPAGTEYGINNQE